VVISRYHRIAGYDWIAIPLIAYLYSVDQPDQVPFSIDQENVSFIRDQYRRNHLREIVPDARSVRRRKRIGDLHGVLQNLPDRQTLAPDQQVECLAGDKLHHNKIKPAVAGDVVDGNDAGMAQGRGGLGFLHEAPLSLRIRDCLSGQNLDGDASVKMSVMGPVDGAHTALTELFANLVVRYCLADHGKLLPQPDHSRTAL
jgi:hypothetical protein